MSSYVAVHGRTHRNWARRLKNQPVGNEEMPDDVRWIRSYVLAEPDGRVGTVCIYQGTSEAKVREHAERAGLACDEVIPVADTVIVKADP